MDKIAKNVFEKIQKKQVAKPIAIKFFMNLFQDEKDFSKLPYLLVQAVEKEKSYSEVRLLPDFLELAFAIQDSKNNSKFIEFKNALVILALDDLTHSSSALNMYIDICILKNLSNKVDFEKIIKNLSLKDRKKVESILQLNKEFTSTYPGELEMLLQFIDEDNSP